jgi:hypothetical protein
MRQTLTTVLEVVGLLLVVAAAASVDYRLGLLAGGGALIGVGFLLERN